MIDPIENKLKDAVLAETPDMLEDLMQELSLAENKQASAEQSSDEANAGDNAPFTAVRSGPRKYFRILAIAAAAVLFFAAGTVFSKIRNRPESTAVPENAAETSPSVSGPSSAADEHMPAAESTSAVEESSLEESKAAPAAIICLDVNPSIELSVDDTDHIISYKAINREAEELLADLELKGAEIRTASYAIIGAMLASGYFKNGSNSLLLSVVAEDPAKGRALENDLIRDINQYLENIAVSSAIFGQYAGADRDVEKFAKKQGLSYGKAWLIRSMLRTDPALTEDSLLKLSTQELLLLWSEKSDMAEEENVISYGTVDTTGYISKEEALAIALSHAGLSGSDPADVKIHFDCENGVIVYEVEFHAAAVEYEYDIRAVDGVIVGYESERYEGEDDHHDGDDHDDYDDYDDDRYDNDRDDDDRDDDDRYDDDDD